MPASPPTELLLPSLQAWRRWLQRNADDATEAWVVISKKSLLPSGLSFDDALDEAMCFGWVDVSSRRRDDTTYLLRFTPRRQRSAWSMTNVTRVQRLSAEGRMQPAGDAAVARAKEAGLWPPGAGPP
ncbi:MAG: hypothetical protein JOZ92_06105 [Candidatus Dormibacteraeota bacterium]|nr:hypothetical protein [Candidatus Dormibacteraeota bacterium]